MRTRVLLLAAVACACGILAPSALAARNVSFVGRWRVSSGVGFTITRENRRTGVCAGRSNLSASGYKLVACRVHGHMFAFTITYGPSYKSRNTGTITGNRLTGTFKDTNGTVESYTATRGRASHASAH